jgi:hypothetical protein
LCNKAGYKQYLTEHSQEVLSEQADPKEMIDWIQGVIYTGWYLTSTQ